MSNPPADLADLCAPGYPLLANPWGYIETSTEECWNIKASTWEEVVWRTWSVFLGTVEEAEDYSPIWPPMPDNWREIVTALCVLHKQQREVAITMIREMTEAARPHAGRTE